MAGTPRWLAILLYLAAGWTALRQGHRLLKLDASPLARKSRRSGAVSARSSAASVDRGRVFGYSLSLVYYRR
jgi:hypothetical protein